MGTANFLVIFIGYLINIEIQATSSARNYLPGLSRLLSRLLFPFHVFQLLRLHCPRLFPFLFPFFSRLQIH
jgi:hypothetical protein